MTVLSEDYSIEPVWTREEALRKGYDHIPVRIGKGRGYIGLKSGSLGLTRCPACERENWALAVATGQCCWCGWAYTGELPDVE
jgi:hypothetical protein